MSARSPQRTARARERAVLAATAIASAIALAGCVSPAPTDRVDFAPLRPGICDEAPTRCDDEGHAWVELPPDAEDRTLGFVVDALSLPPPDVHGRVPGLDLDGLDSGAGSEDPGAPCGVARPDFVSSVESSVRGVDNQLAGLVPTIEGLLDPADCAEGVTTGCLDQVIEDDIATGRLLLLVEVSGVDSFVHDASISVAVYRGNLPRRAELEFEATGRLAADQLFEAVFLGQGTGTIFDGRVAVELDSLPFDLHAADFNLSLDLEPARMRFDLSETALTRGVLAGVHHHYERPDATVCSVIGSIADFGEASEECDGECTGVSVGMAFTGVAAVIAGP